MQRLGLLFLFSFSLKFLASTAASPVQWTVGEGGNGHYYEFVAEEKKWTLARFDAVSRKFNGQAGYLVTITSPQENTFVSRLLIASGARSAWLGATDTTREGVWVWIDGPESGQTFWNGVNARMWPAVPFHAWDTGAPKNSTNDGVAAMWGKVGGSDGSWYDTSSNYTSGYIVEYSSATTNQTSPVTAAMELLVNGNFESGNIGFTNSLSYAVTNTVHERTYTIGSDPHNVHSEAAPFKDHTTGTGLMLLVNGNSQSNDIVWSQTIGVKTNRTYLFSGWGATWNNPSGQGFDPFPPKIVIYINGVQVGEPVTMLAINGQWQSFATLWHSASSSQARIELRFGGAMSSSCDIALDDLSFISISTTSLPSTGIYRSVEVEWQSTSNSLYQVQWASSVSSNTWHNLGIPVLARDIRTSITDRVSIWEQRFYRVLSVE